MQPRPVTPDDLVYFATEGEPVPPRAVTFTPPPGLANSSPCETIVTEADGSAVVRVPWSLDAEEVAQLAAGGTLWLSSWGGLSPHMLEVQRPTGDPVTPGGVDDALVGGEEVARSPLGDPPGPGVSDEELGYRPGLVGAIHDGDAAAERAELETVARCPVVDPQELLDSGVVAEVNRRLLHPLGLAVAYARDTGHVFVLDGRDDPEGVYFADVDDDLRAKVERVAAAEQERRPARVSALGYWVQPVGREYDGTGGEQ